MGKRAHRLLPLAVAGGLVALNLVPLWRGSIAFEDRHFVEEFGTSRGFPFKFWAPADDEGSILVEGSVVQGDARVYRDVLGGARPHLAVNVLFAVLDLAVAAILVGGSFVWTARRSMRVSDSPAMPRR